jgi:hypothetical protein
VEIQQLLSAATYEFEELIGTKIVSLQTFLLGLTPTESTDYSLWKFAQCTDTDYKN